MMPLGGRIFLVRNSLFFKICPDLLVLDLGVLSRPHLVRDMPRTAAALDARGFVDFLRYASLGDAGDGAAPGRAALLGDGAATGLWAELRAGGYTTFAARDACPDGRPALPDADYGAALRAACCSDGDGDPPHYLWGTAAARLLLSHYEQFARAYGPGGGRPRVPTASLLVFVDADEDSLALAALLDAPLSSLLGGIEMHGTAVVLLSSADTAPTGTDGTCWRAPLPARDPPTGHREEPAQNVPVRHRAGGTFGTVDLPSWQSMGAASIPNQLAALTGCSQRWIEGSGRVPVPHRGDAWCRRRPGPGGVRHVLRGGILLHGIAVRRAGPLLSRGARRVAAPAVLPPGGEHAEAAGQRLRPPLVRRVSPLRARPATGGAGAGAPPRALGRAHRRRARLSVPERPRGARLHRRRGAAFLRGLPGAAGARGAGTCWWCRDACPRRWCGGTQTRRWSRGSTCTARWWRS